MFINDIIAACIKSREYLKGDDIEVVVSFKDKQLDITNVYTESKNNKIIIEVDE